MPFLARPAETASRLLRLFVVFCLLHLPYLSSFSLSVDDEYSAFRDDARMWIAQGRWTLYLLESLWLTQPTVTFFPGLIFGGCAALAFLLLLDAHRTKVEGVFFYLLFILFAGFPTWFFLMEFYANLPGAGFGLTLSAVAVWSFSRLTARWQTAAASVQHQNEPAAPPADHSELFAKPFLRRCAHPAVLAASAVFCLALAAGTYQSFLLLGASGFAGVMLMQCAAGVASARDILRSAWVAGALLLGGAALYYLLWKLFLFATGTEVAYIGIFFDLAQLIGSPLSILARTAGNVVDVYGGDSDVYGQDFLLLAVLELASLAAVCLAARRTGFARATLCVVLLLAALLAPFLMNLTADGFMPYRSLVAVPYAVLLSGLILTKFVRARALAGLLIAAVATQAVYVTSLFHTSNALVFDYDRATASRLYARIVGVHPDFDRTQEHPVLLIGALEFPTVYPRIDSSIVGHSFFEWDGGNPGRILTFMRLLGYDHLREMDKAEAARRVTTFLAMPLWPAEGSVRADSEATIVRLGQRPGGTQDNLTRTMRQLPFLASPENVLYRLNASGLAASVRNADASVSGSALQLAGRSDPEIMIPLPPEAAARCRTVQLTVQQTLGSGDTVQAFFQRKGESRSEENYDSAPQAAGVNKTSLFFRSESGFAPSIRFLPGTSEQNYSIERLDVGCVD